MNKTIQEKKAINERLTKLINKFSMKGNEVVQKTIVAEVSPNVIAVEVKPISEQRNKVLSAPAVAVTEPKQETKSVYVPVGVDTSEAEPEPEDKWAKAKQVRDDEAKKFMAHINALNKAIITPDNQTFVPVAQKKPISSNVYYIVPGKYWLAYDGGKVYFVKPQAAGENNNPTPTLLKRPQSGETASGIYSIRQQPAVSGQGVINRNNNQAPQDLTKQDLDGIIAGKPSANDLCDVYQQYAQRPNEIETIDTSKATPVW